MEHHAKRRREEIHNNSSSKYRGNSFTSSSSQNLGLRKPNAAMVSSLNYPKAQTHLILPPKNKEQTQLYQPKREKLDINDDDDDFKTPPQSKTSTTQLVKPVRNPFAKSSVLEKPNMDDTNDFKQTPKLMLPKKNKTVTQTNIKKDQLLETLKAHRKQQSDDKDKRICPFCSETLFPMRTKVAEALKAIELRDKQHEERQIKEMEKENSNSSFAFRMVSKRLVSNDEKDTFCSLHHRELVTLPNGRDKGYPVKIDFDGILNRIKRFDSELRDVISNSITSEYRKIAEDAYKEQGVTKARSAMSVMLRFEASLPGYYGPKGASAIIDALSTLYLKSGYLSKNLVSPQLPMEFIQQVLVPETGFRLIRQDMIKEAASIPPNCTDTAKAIMTESCNYGSAMFPMEDPDEY